MNYSKLIFIFLFVNTFGINSSMSCSSVPNPIVIPSVNTEKQCTSTTIQEPAFETFFDTDDTDFLYDDSMDDDDDGSFTTRKKASFEDIACFDFAQYNLHHFSNNLQNKFCYTNFHFMPNSHFISLRVFRL